MALPELDIRVFGESIVRRRLVRVQSRMVDHREAFHEIVGILRESTKANFATRGVSGGSRWRDLKPATIAAKQRKGQDIRILRATGRLYGSLIGAEGSTGRARSDVGGRFIPGGSDHVEEITADTLRWGSRVPYGQFHQSSAPRKVIPYRPPVRLTEREKRAVVSALQRGMLG
jgi:phage gpG-like protein